MKKVLIVGLPFFHQKYSYVVNSYKEIGVETGVLLNCNPLSSRDILNISNNNSMDTFYFAGKKPLKRIYMYFYVLSKFKPKNIDCYDYSILSIFYILVGRLFGINIRFWLIGWELVGDKQNINKDSILIDIFIFVKKLLTKKCLVFANVIYAKENHHVQSINKINPDLLVKVKKIYNCVPVLEEKPDLSSLNRRDFLYANAVIEKRNVIPLIKSFAELKKSNISFSATIYGFNSISNDVYDTRGVSYSKKALQVYYDLKLEQNVEVKGFVKNIKEKMAGYRFFILPADIILANYALLESMSLGIVPIIYPGDGYNLIVQDGINGIVVKDFNLTEALQRALSLSHEEYEKMSIAAHRKIKEDFSMELWQKQLSEYLV